MRAGWQVWNDIIPDGYLQYEKGRMPTYLTGVLGLPKKRRGERIFGSNENFSFTFSSTDGATYVKPYRRRKRKK